VSVRIRADLIRLGPAKGLCSSLNESFGFEQELGIPGTPERHLAPSLHSCIRDFLHSCLNFVFRIHRGTAQRGRFGLPLRWGVKLFGSPRDPNRGRSGVRERSLPG